MARRKKLKSVSLAQPIIVEETPLDVRSNVIPNRKTTTIDVVIDNPNHDPNGTIQQQEAVKKLHTKRSAHDPLIVMYHSQGTINDAQKLAGEHWRECYRICAIGGGLRGQDVTREYVDTSPGFNYECSGDRQIKASNDLKKASRALGIVGEWLVKSVLIDGYFPGAVAKLLGFTSERKIRDCGDAFRRALETLARVWGNDPGARFSIGSMFVLD